MNPTRDQAIEALRRVTDGGPCWSSAWWQDGEVIERQDVTRQQNECRPGEHRFLASSRAAGYGYRMARCTICGARVRFLPLDAPPRCAAMVKPRGFPMSAMRQCRQLAQSPDGKHCWTHFRGGVS